jgi:hypothetical protein
MKLPAILCIQIGYETVRNGHILSFFGYRLTYRLSSPSPFELLVVAKIMQSAAASCRPHCHLERRKPPPSTWLPALLARYCRGVRSEASRHIYLPYIPFPQSYTLMVGKFMNITTKKYSLRHGRSNKVPFVGGRMLLTTTR